MSPLCHAASDVSGQLLNESSGGHVRASADARCSSRSSRGAHPPPLHVFSRVRVMDGLLSDSSDANIGLSACAGSGPCKLKLSVPPPTFN